jgi:hypothetical protein
VDIHIEIVDHDTQRYETLGDWIFSGEDLYIAVSSLNDWKMEALIGIHEAIEAILCKHNGVTEESVSEFDIKFEKDRKPGYIDEPGDSPYAPYRKYHSIATSIERMLAEWLDVNWQEYERACLEVSG